MPVTTTLISPPAWVNSTIRRRTSAIQSMFSVPLSIAILAPAESANHSSGNAELLGQVERGDDPPALGLGQRAERARRVAQQDHAQHPLRIALGDVADRADDDARLVGRRRPVDGHEAAVVVEVVLDEGARPDGRAVARAGASRRTISAGCRTPRRRAATIRRAPSSSGCSGSVGGSPTSTTTPSPTSVKKRSTRSRTVPSGSRRRPRDEHVLDAEAEGRSAPGAA